MKQSKTYESTDKMIDLIRDNYSVLQSLSAFGINLGFGDKSVEEVCQKAGVDTSTFLMVVNRTINGVFQFDSERLSVETLLRYLSACHHYFLDYQLSFVRRSLCESVCNDDDISKLILKVYDTYALDIRRHMKYEERMLFPYIRRLIDGETSTNYCIEDFVKHHSEADKSLKELKDLIVKYMPQSSQGGSEGSSNPLLSTLYLIYNNEKWLNNHQDVEDNILVPMIRKMEQKLKSERIHHAISSFVNAEPNENGEVVTDREKDVIVAVVQGLSNKQIAESLCISPYTVITHRRNIARKLQIHSPAGLTIYAIANGLVDIPKLKE